MSNDNVTLTQERGVSRSAWAIRFGVVNILGTLLLVFALPLSVLGIIWFFVSIGLYVATLVVAFRSFFAAPSGTRLDVLVILSLVTFVIGLEIFLAVEAVTIDFGEKVYVIDSDGNVIGHEIR